MLRSLVDKGQGWEQEGNCREEELICQSWHGGGAVFKHCLNHSSTLPSSPFLSHSDCCF